MRLDVLESLRDLIQEIRNNIPENDLEKLNGN